MAGHFRAFRPAGPQNFPDLPQFSGFMKPCRFEGEVQNLEVRGTIPENLDGTFYRVMPDPQFPSFVDNDPWFNGDGNVSAFRIQSGKCHFKQRYVRTEKFVRERQAQRALLGKYRNKYTDAVEFKVRSTANTSVFHFNGKLLACKEDSPPYALDPETLETLDLEDFNGQIPSLTFTAHPKLDSKTGELHCFGYEAKGDGTPDICYYTIDANWQVTKIIWLVAPVVGMIHDFAVTENYILFPIIPQVCDLERMKEGGEHWQWDPKIPFYLGVLPRHNTTGDDVKWFRAPNAFPGHTANAFDTEDGNIVFDLPLTDRNVFFWWPDAQGNAPDPHTIRADFVRYKFDPKSTNLDLGKGEIILPQDCEFPRIDDRYSMAEYRHCFLDLMDPTLGTDFPAIAPVMGGGHAPYNAIAHFDLTTKELRKYFPGPKHLVQECVFAPRTIDAPEGDGFVLFLVNNYGTMGSELHILDTDDFEKAAAVVNLPVRLRAGLHGNWVDKKDVQFMD